VDPNYSALKLRLENAHAAVEAATVEAGEDQRGRRQAAIAGY
jgi:hypothetical protein